MKDKKSNKTQKKHENVLEWVAKWLIYMYIVRVFNASILSGPYVMQYLHIEKF